MPMAILGISFSSRVVGLAIIKNHLLIDFKTRLFKESWSDQKVERFMAELIRCIKAHHITKIALTVPHEYHSTEKAKALITHINAICRAKKISISTYNPKALNWFCEKAKAKKKALMHELATRYPELTYIHRRELRNKSKYYIKLFEAVAVALLLSRDMNL
jgi:RNase H-fold protein (predicted Holliday junction resolvase)